MQPHQQLDARLPMSGAKRQGVSVSSAAHSVVSAFSGPGGWRHAGARARNSHHQPIV